VTVEVTIGAGEWTAQEDGFLSKAIAEVPKSDKMKEADRWKTAGPLSPSDPFSALPAARASHEEAAARVYGYIATSVHYEQTVRGGV